MADETDGQSPATHELGQLYQAVILEHNARPRNAGRLDAPTHAGDGHNPLCGDRVALTLRVTDDVVTEARCEARGCAICRASGSLMTEAITGRPRVEVLLLSARMLALVEASGAAVAKATPGLDHPTPETAVLPAPLQAVAYVRHFPGRARCATLAWQVLQDALEPSP